MPDAPKIIYEGLPKGRRLKPMDAIHLATAQWLSSAGLRVEEFHTYDQGLFRYNSELGFQIVEPRIENPRMF